MKLLDPFAGYRLASGHPVFHLAYFAGSWVVTYYEKEEHFITRGSIVEVFHLLRWVHLIVFVISIVSGWADRPSNLPIDANLEEDGQAKDSINRVLHRDSKWRTFSRFCDCISVFLYQGSVFFAQWTLATSEQCTAIGDRNDTSADNWDCDHLVGAEALWIIIETISFYIYMGAAVWFILQFQLISAWFNAPQSDITKSCKDFISYASINLTWYAFNFVLILLPPTLMFLMNTEHDGIKLDGRTETY